jgi:hypothetical protein
MFLKSRDKAGFVSEQALPDTPWPVAARGLMSEREKSLYQNLISLYPDHKIFVQVALSQLVDVARDHPERMAIRARFKQLVADFVLCRPDLTIVAVIELDDRTHLRADRKRADARKSKALADAGLRLVRIPAGAIPPIGKLRALIEAGRSPAVTAVGTTDLTLAETVPTFARNATGDVGSLSGAGVTRKQKRALWRIATTILFAVFVWFAYTNFLPYIVHRALESLAPKPVTPHAVAKALVKPIDAPAIAAVPSATPTASSNSVAERPTGQATTFELKRQKNREWAAYYSASPSCEHPGSWNDQVECGNQYMRAKKRFEQQWAAAHPSEQAQQTIVLDNTAIKGTSPDARSSNARQ